MKKVFLSLAAVALLASGSFTMTSCGGSDDNSGVVEPVQKGIKLALVTNVKDVVAGQAFELSISKADGTPITGAVLYANGEATEIESQDGTFSVSAPAGDWTISAEYQGEMSNEVEVTVQEAVVKPSEGKGAMLYDGATSNIEEASIIFRGLGYADDTKTTVVANWQIEAVAGSNIGIVMFTTPATPASGNNYSVAMPTANNTVGKAAGVINGTTVVAQTNDNVTVDFSKAQVSLQNNIANGAYNGKAADVKGSPFSIEFDGTTPVIRNTNKGAKNSNGFVSASETFTVKAENLDVIKFN